MLATGWCQAHWLTIDVWRNQWNLCLNTGSVRVSEWSISLQDRPLRTFESFSLCPLRRLPRQPTITFEDYKQMYIYVLACTLSLSQFKRYTGDQLLALPSLVLWRVRIRITPCSHAHHQRLRCPFRRPDLHIQLPSNFYPYMQERLRNMS